MELVLYGTKEIPEYARHGPRVYPQEYRRKSIGEANDAKLRLRALVDNVQNWI